MRLLSRLLGPEAVLVVDADRARAEDVALEHGASVADGIDGILNDVDVAVVAVPTVDHLEVSARLIEAGTHVLMEKPIAADLDQADAMIAAAAARGVVLAVGHVEFLQSGRPGSARAGGLCPASSKSNGCRHSARAVWTSTSSST